MFNEVIAVFSVISTCIMLYIASRFYRKAPPWIDDKIENVMSTVFEPDEQGKNLVDVVAERFGTSFRMSLLAQRSGEVRHEKAIEKRVFEAAVENSPELKIGLEVLDKFGLGDLATPENVPALLSLANKYGLFNMGKGNSPGGSNPRDYGGKM